MADGTQALPGNRFPHKGLGKPREAAREGEGAGGQQLVPLRKSGGNCGEQDRYREGGFSLPGRSLPWFTFNIRILLYILYIYYGKCLLREISFPSMSTPEPVILLAKSNIRFILVHIYVYTFFNEGT